MLAGAPTFAEPLALKQFTSADGLGHNRIYRIVTDRRGFMWFCTFNGLTRFDGQRFTNFGSEDGAPFFSVIDIIERPGGDFWIGTNGQGVVLMHESNALEPVRSATGHIAFRAYPIPGPAAANRANRLLLDHSGVLWIGTDGGLFRLVESKGAVQIVPVPLGIPGHPDTQVEGLAEGDDGSLWVGTQDGLVRVLPGGGQVCYPRTSDNAYYDDLGAVLFAQGVVWYGQQQGLFMLKPPALRRPLGAGEVEIDRALIVAEQTPLPVTQSTSLPRDTRHAGLLRFGAVRSGQAAVVAIHQSRNGAILVATQAGVFQFRNGTMAPFLKELPFRHVYEFGEDPAGNLWVATQSSGAARIAPQGYASYGAAEGISDVPIAVAFDRAGEVIAAGGTNLFVLTGARFRRVVAPLPPGATIFIRGCPLQDRLGRWWFGTTKGVYRSPPAARLADISKLGLAHVATREPGLADNEIYGFFEDSSGNIWMPGAPVALTVWERSRDRFLHYSHADGLPKEDKPDVIVEDRHGRIILGFRDGSVLRYRDGRFETLARFDDGRAQHIGGIAVDADDRLWCSIGQHGLVRIEEAAPGRFETRTYTTAQGLTSNPLGSGVLLDERGLVYVGSAHGVDRLNPATGVVDHFGEADGIPNEYVANLARGADGAVWVATQNHLVRMAPERREISTPGERPAQVLIGGLRVSGVEYQVPVVGAKNLVLPDLSYLKNSLQIDLLCLSFAPGQSRLFQWKLDGTESDWSPPSPNSTVNYANLSPGEYRFLVRQAAFGGTAAPAAAQLSFRILPPFWKRSWFLGSIAALALAGFVAFERYRAAKLKQLRAVMESLKSANAALDVESAVSRILANSSDESACPLLLESLCRKTGRRRGAFWLRDSATGSLRLAAEWPGPTTEPEARWIETDLAQLSVQRMQIERRGDRTAFPILSGYSALGAVELDGPVPAGELESILVSSTGMIGQWLDLLRAESALRASEARFRTLAETASDAILTVDCAGAIVFANPSVRAVFGFAPENIAGQPFTMLLPAPLRDLAFHQFKSYLETGERRMSWKATELPGLHAAGYEIILDVSFGEFQLDSDRFFTAAVRDITDRKQTEERLNRAREERIAEIERVRRRIATDLHDDIGSSLTQISVLSEVARQVAAVPAIARPLELIAASSRELIDSMSDIVWAINPQRDRLADLVHRMRRFASDTLTARDIDFTLQLPEAEEDVKVEGNLRREVFLIFKEALTNALRHSGCTRVDIHMRLHDKALRLDLRDNGKGFDQARESEGHGLASMSSRAAGIGARFEIASQPGEGSSISLEVVLSPL